MENKLTGVTDRELLNIFAQNPNTDLSKYEIIREVNLRDVKRGDYFKLAPNSSEIWVRYSYSKKERKFEVCKFSDANHYKFMSPNRKVFIGFTF